MRVIRKAFATTSMNFILDCILLNMIIGERGKICSVEEVLGSKNVTKTFVPTLSPCNLIDVNSDSDRDHPDGQHQSKV